jgi:hypothetical protein
MIRTVLKVKKSKEEEGKISRVILYAGSWPDFCFSACQIFGPS